MNLDFHKLLLNALKAVCFSVFVVKFYQKMIHHTFRYTTFYLNSFMIVPSISMDSHEASVTKLSTNHPIYVA